MKLITIAILFAASSAFAQEVADVSNPTAVKINTPDQGIVVSGTLHDTIKNYPKLAGALKTETAKKLAAEDEIAAQKRFLILQSQKIDMPKDVIDKHNARIAKFAKAKEDAINGAVKNARVTVQIDNTTSQDRIDAYMKALNDARSLAQKAKVKKDELLGVGIPISKATQDAVEAAQPKPTPTPTPAPTPVPDGL